MPPTQPTPWPAGGRRRREFRSGHENSLDSAGILDVVHSACQENKPPANKAAADTCWSSLTLAAERPEGPVACVQTLRVRLRGRVHVAAAGIQRPWSPFEQPQGSPEAPSPSAIQQATNHASRQRKHHQSSVTQRTEFGGYICVRGCE